MVYPLQRLSSVDSNDGLTILRKALAHLECAHGCCHREREIIEDRIFTLRVEWFGSIRDIPTYEGKTITRVKGNLKH